MNSSSARRGTQFAGHSIKVFKTLLVEVTVIVPRCGKAILSTGSRVVRSRTRMFCREDSKQWGVGIVIEYVENIRVVVILGIGDSVNLYALTGKLLPFHNV